MNLSNLLAHWKSDPDIEPNIIEWRKIPGKRAQFKAFPPDISPILRRVLMGRGINALYSHQADTYDAVRKSKNVVIATGTASGKTLCYNLPILDGLIKNPQATALYLFPTKALSQDQYSVLRLIISEINKLSNEEERSSQKYPDIKCAIYDGDTPASARSAIRNGVNILFTNPDMLHTGILPHHTGWDRYFSNLKYVIIDEVHTYRGVFGSNVANVIRRLKRIAKFYGANPQFILTSATIGNPEELSKKIINDTVSVIDDDGADKGEKNFLIYNPPIIDKSLGLRKSSIQSGVNLAMDLLDYNIQTIIFSRARRTVEIILTYLREQSTFSNHRPGVFNQDPDHAIRGYRSGYLPKQRRSIEQGLKSGDVRIVVATNALELGIDIGDMDASLLIGYPGTISSTWQEAGRAGRGARPSLSILITSPSPLDQYLAQHPEYIFNKSPEYGMINPDNLLILLAHIRCAAFELPFQSGEVFGTIRPADMKEMMDYLQEEGVIHQSGSKYFWMSDKYPAQNISLRSASTERILLQAPLVEDGIGFKLQTIGEVDTASSYWLTHPGAIYMHEGSTFLVNNLDLEKKIATIEPTNVDYYTEPQREVSVREIEKYSNEAVLGGQKFYGEIQVTSQVVGFRKIRWHTNENLGIESLDMPPFDLMTTGYWLSLADKTIDKLKDEGLWSNSPNNYGPNWSHIRELVRARDLFRCQICGEQELLNQHHVHHKIPFRFFDSLDQANQMENLITLCNSCHRKVETAVRIRSGLAGLAFTLGNLAPLFLMCDIGDLGIHSDPQSQLAEGKPAVILYDMIPGGIGLSERLYDIHDELMIKGRELVEACGCEDGCPSCVGPGGEGGSGGKKETLALLKELSS